jgi:hypothetical protein
LRDATGIVPAELRALAPAAGDIIAFSDSSLELRATIGTAVACDTAAGGGAIHLAPDPGTGGPYAPPLAAFATPPGDGDVALIFDGGSQPVAADAWVSVPVSGYSVAAGLCASSPWRDVLPGDRESVRLRVGAGHRVPATVRPGAIVRVLRRVRYRFYRAASSEWFLGYSEWNGSGFSVVQPVSGPFAPYRAGARGGFALRYFDDTGAELASGANASAIARVEIVARALSAGGFTRDSGPPDSQTVTIRPRNR